MPVLSPTSHASSTPLTAIRDVAICTAAVYSSAIKAVLTPEENIFKSTGKVMASKVKATNISSKEKPLLAFIDYLDLSC